MLAGSTAWRSSIASSTGPSAATCRIAPSAPTAIVPASTPASLARRRRATSTAARWGSGSVARAPSGRSSKRSMRVVYETGASVPAGRARSTRRPSSRAASAAACQSAVLPMPASPSMTIATGPPATAAMASHSVAQSESRPSSAEGASRVVAMSRFPHPAHAVCRAGWRPTGAVQCTCSPSVLYSTEKAYTPVLPEPPLSRHRPTYSYSSLSIVGESIVASSITS